MVLTGAATGLAEATATHAETTDHRRKAIEAISKAPAHRQAASADQVLKLCNLPALRTAHAETVGELRKQEVDHLVRTATIIPSPESLLVVWDGVADAEQTRRRSLLAGASGQDAIFTEYSRRNPSAAGQWIKAREASQEMDHGPEMSM